MSSSKSHTISARACIIAVLAIAAILVISWYVPVMTQRTRNPIEMQEIKSLEMAIKSYQLEYHKLPNLGTTDETKYIESAGVLIETLTGKGDSQNPREIAFYEPMRRSTQTKTGNDTAAPSNETDIRDLKGNHYRLHFDWDGDRRISNPNPSGTEVTGSVLVYSAGRDGDYTTWEDNFTTWDH
jgi:type II secretory pathway pseudopilin PulG